MHRRLPAVAGSLRPGARWGRTAARLALLLAAGPAPAADLPGCLRLTPLSPPGDGAPGFTALTPAQTGITFTNLLAAETSLTNQIYLNGSGVAAGDVDGDGICDLYFCGLDAPNALYRGLGGGRFADITVAAGVACADQASTGAAFADVDGDGDLDLLVNGIARGTRLFLNDGRGRFVEATATSGLRGGSGAASLALADVDGDGDLDLYVVNYRNTTMRDEPEKRFRVATTNGVARLVAVDSRPADSPELAGRFDLHPVAGLLENGEPDVLYLNDGTGRFTPVPWDGGVFLDEAGHPVRAPHDWGLAAMFRDVNGDGAPDLYVCNDFQSPDRLWLNDGRGRFRAAPRATLGQTSLFSMGVDFADVDRDGRDDFFVADMLSRDQRLRQVQLMDAAAVAAADPGGSDRPQSSRNTLFWNRGDGTWAEVARLAGVEASEWSWCPAFLDVDLDGFEDLLITTGHERDAQNADVAGALAAEARAGRLSFAEQLRLRRRFPRLDTPNVAFRNRGGLAFEDASAAWGFDSRRVSQGLALADLDGDGDLDVIVNCLNDGPLVLRNNAACPRILVRLRGRPPNTAGVGARVRVLAPGLPPQTQEIIAGGRYVSDDDDARTFAAGDSGRPLTIEVTWRSGARSIVTNVPPGHLCELDEAAASPAPAATPPASAPPLFTEAGLLPGPRAAAAPFDDFARQPLLPRRVSTGPVGLAWFDFNGDGWDDLLVGAPRGGRLAVFRNDGRGGFVPQRAALLETPAPGALRSLLGWRAAADQPVLLQSVSDWEDDSAVAPALVEIALASGATQRLPLEPGAGGPLALADFDGDGRLDLFAGGGPRPGRYPEAGPSRLFLGRDGRFVADAGADALLAAAGPVNGAGFTDLDGDGRPELVLATECGPLRILRRRGESAQWWRPAVVWELEGGKEPARLGLEELTGRWTCLAAGDFDGDGRMDLVAGNWGRNHRDARYLDRPLELHFADGDGDGRLDLIEARYDPALRSVVPVRDRDALSAAFPSLRAAFGTHAEFAATDLPALQAAGLPPLQKVTARTLDSLLLLNRGDHFLARPLPREAQLAPVMGLAVGDLDGDGHQDVLMTQNFFGVSAAESRLDAGRGGWLRGDGAGRLAFVPQRESGFSLPGEGRAVALADYDQDGRLDAAAGRHPGEIRLWRNTGAQPGLRVRLTGPSGNLPAAGAFVRPVYRDGSRGPAHEIQLGAGTGAQAGADLVLGRALAIIALVIRWPDGAAETVQVPAGAHVVTCRRASREPRRAGSASPRAVMASTIPGCAARCRGRRGSTRAPSPQSR
jgi:hypothetical protein